MIDSSAVNFSDNIHYSKLIRHLQDQIIACGGESLMPVLKRMPVPFRLLLVKTVRLAGLSGVVLQ